MIYEVRYIAEFKKTGMFSYKNIFLTNEAFFSLEKAKKFIKELKEYSYYRNIHLIPHPKAKKYIMGVNGRKIDPRI